MDGDKLDNSSGSIKLKYKTQSQNLQVSKTTNSLFYTRQQYAPTTDPTLNIPCYESVFNVQLNYDLDAALDPEFWDGNFHAVLLHSSMEHLTSDALNIKVSLNRMRKFIVGKSINSDKANNIKNMNSIGKAI